MNFNEKDKKYEKKYEKDKKTASKRTINYFGGLGG
jgi:hypothetical protein